MRSLRYRFSSALLVLLAVGCGGSDGRPKLLSGERVTFEDVQSRVFTPRCATADCHLAPDAPFGLDLSQGQAYGNLVGVPSSERDEFDRVDPGDASGSYLYMKVTADPRILGDPMPADGTTLGDGRLGLIADWIEQGANP